VSLSCAEAPEVHYRGDWIALVNGYLPEDGAASVPSRALIGGNVQVASVAVPVVRQWWESRL
jgi:hypothetical protein